jgi:hypothetical protein
MAETLIKIVGVTTSKVSLASGTIVNGQATIYLPISKVQFDTALCADLATHITHNHIRVYINGVLQTANDMNNLVGSPISLETKEHTDFQESVLSRFDNTAALPASPSDGDRRYALVTAQGWTANRIYVYSASAASWEEVVPTIGTQIYVENELMLYIWNGTSLNSFAESTQIRCRITAINLKALAAYTGTINGISTDRFIPTNLIFRVTAVGGAALTGNCSVTVGIGAGTTEILPIAQLTGLIGLNTSFSIPIAGLVNTAILANAVLHCSVTTADTSAGTGTAELWISGFSI